MSPSENSVIKEIYKHKLRDEVAFEMTNTFNQARKFFVQLDRLVDVFRIDDDDDFFWWMRRQVERMVYNVNYDLTKLASLAVFEDKVLEVEKSTSSNSDKAKIGKGKNDKEVAK